jgi:oligoendopeptidase F
LPTSLPLRCQLPPATTWNLADIFPSDEAWAAELKQVTARLAEAERYRGRLGESPARLLEWFDWSGSVRQAVNRVTGYAHLQHDEDTTRQDAAARNAQGEALRAQLVAALAFARPELLALDPARLRQWLADEPRLAGYAHYLDDLESQRPHVRSAEVEELLGQVAGAFRSAEGLHGILANADLKFAPARPADGSEPLEVAQGTYSTSLVYSPDREVRRTAWESYADAHLAVKNTLAACLSTGVRHNVLLAQARGYPSSLEAALAPHHIPPAVFHNLIDTFKQHLPTWRRYWRLRRQVLGYDRLHVYDARAPLTDRMPVVPYPQAVEWIVAGLRPLGEDYGQLLRRGALEERWVDVYPNQGKRSGAYSSGQTGVHPYILMSYADNLFSVSTLAHELGHALHSYHTHQHQPPVYDSYSLFVAETASNFHQAMVRAHLLQTQTDRDFQIALIEEGMNNFHRYFFIMPTLARFELEIHQRVERGEALTAESLNRLMADLFREGYGDEVELDDERVGSTWMQFSTHLYSNFYVYQYATGISGAHALAAGVLAGQPGAAENYLAFLKAGNSLYPLDALKLAGVDMSTPEPVEQTFGILAGLVERLEQLLTQPA